VFGKPAVGWDGLSLVVGEDLPPGTLGHLVADENRHGSNLARADVKHHSAGEQVGHLTLHVISGGARHDMRRFEQEFETQIRSFFS
jgi:hypothetical protein